MNVRRGLLILGAVGGLLMVSAILHEGQALAQHDSEKPIADTNPRYDSEELVAKKNPLIDCSTNPAFDDQYIASAFRAGGGHAGGRGQQCSACHQSDSPRSGTGDRPIAKYGTTLIRNLLSETVAYELKIGEKGKWKKHVLEPGKIRRAFGAFGDIFQSWFALKNFPECWEWRFSSGQIAF